MRIMKLVSSNQCWDEPLWNSTWRSAFVFPNRKSLQASPSPQVWLFLEASRGLPSIAKRLFRAFVVFKDGYARSIGHAVLLAGFHVSSWLDFEICQAPCSRQFS